MESGQIASQAEIPWREGISRARVTHVLGLLRLAPETQENILARAGSHHHRPMTERMLRPIGAIAESPDQIRGFRMNML